MDLPTAAMETNNPEQALREIMFAVDSVKERLREDHVLRRELKSYGYFRNMLSIRKIAVFVSGISALAMLTVFLYLWLVSNQLKPVFMFLALYDALLCLYWTRFISTTSLARSANRYAEQLFKSATKL